MALIFPVIKGKINGKTPKLTDKLTEKALFLQINGFFLYINGKKIND